MYILFAGLPFGKLISENGMPQSNQVDPGSSPQLPQNPMIPV